MAHYHRGCSAAIPRRAGPAPYNSLADHTRDSFTDLSLSSPLPAPRSASPAHELPLLLPDTPVAGQRLAVRALAGSADALALAQRAGAAAARSELIVVVCAEALAVQRLAGEIAWFAPG